ncbi:sensor histidine kinase [Butyrivibrio sp. YAB3001]|uniref:sensor histidine kinase n=1 Tax=Butyrivibrio sp. YAB3001 TaxID=1520812 RepID=UPI0008F63179|nr:HAMP domain-containing sensor histidine kinase [Butyrivibrio sp. YAB3001]SFC84177.1 Signal transduction histidine kinase [Butyrivibrio sp. YAB3001]
MVKKLRKKFVITAMLSLLVIIIVMISVINAANIFSMVSDADKILYTLTSNNGFFPGLIAPTDPRIFNKDNDNNQDLSEVQAPPPISDDFIKQKIFTFDRLNNTRSMEMPYQSRYFFVRFNSEGMITEENLTHIAAVSLSDASTIATAVFNGKKNSGFYHSYRYSKKETDNGSILIVFVDLSSALISAFKLLLQTLFIGAVALVAMFILVYLFSSQAVAPVVESLEKQKQFITDAGHELKTPLAVISANIDVLELESGKNEWTSSVRNQIKRMNSLVKNLLTLSRMDEERMHVVFSDFDLSNTVRETAISFQAIAESKNKKYTFDITDNIHITGDKNSMNQLTSLLLDNAMKYSSENGVISLSLTKEKNIVLDISNTCDKVPEGNLDRLFDRFYRADSSRSRDTGGYGIGLSVARAIAISHGGNIKAVKDGDKIIRFVVTLPIQAPKKK